MLESIPGSWAVAPWTDGQAQKRSRPCYLSIAIFFIKGKACQDVKLNVFQLCTFGSQLYPKQVILHSMYTFYQFMQLIQIDKLYLVLSFSENYTMLTPFDWIYKKFPNYRKMMWMFTAG